MPWNLHGCASDHSHGRGLGRGWMIRQLTLRRWLKPLDCTAKVPSKKPMPFARVTIDSDGDLAVSQPVIVRGGVTETHLRNLLGFWRATMDRVDKAIEKHSDAADRRVLN
jgi:hypothetical protein